MISKLFPVEALTSLGAGLEWCAVAIFAVTGALVASRKEMDIFGFALLATVTGIGGGTLRDLFLGQTPVFWVKEPAYIGICLVVSTIVYFTAHIPQSRYRLLLWLDAAGLAMVAVVGANKGLEAGAGPFIAVVMGVITAVFGGILRDVLGGESPVILRREIYVIPVIVGAITFVALDGLGVKGLIPALAGFGAAFAVRGLALYYGWSLPAYKSRPGRDYSQTATPKIET